MCTALANTYIRAIRTIVLGVVSIAQLVEVTDSAVLGGVAKVVSSNPTVGHKIFFSIYGIVDLFYIYSHNHNLKFMTGGLNIDFTEFHQSCIRLS